MFQKLNLPELLVALVLIGAPWGACGAQAGQTLNRGLGGEPDVLDPHKTTLAVEATILTDLYEGLVKLDARGDIVPGAATHWDVSEDGLTWTFHLRDNLLWSNGNALTSEDFLRGARRLFSPVIASPGAIFFFGIRNSEAVAKGSADPQSLGVEAPDPRTVTIELENPDPYILRLLTQMSLLPWPEAEGSGRSIIGNGPFTLSDWKPFSTIELIRNPLYRNAETVRLDKVIYHPAPDPASAVKRFRAGELDISPGVPAAQFKPLKELLGDRLRSGRTFSTSYLGLNLEAKPLDDIRVRTAMFLAMEREMITERILRAGQVPAWRYTPDLLTDYPLELSSFADKNTAARRDEARRLLSAAGYGPDNPLQLQLRYIGDDQGRMIAVAVRSMLAGIGVKVDVLTSDLKTHYSDLVMGKYQLALVGWNANPDPSSFLTAFEHSDGTNTFNISGYNNPRFDDLMTQARRLVGIKERNAAFAAAEETLLSDAAIVPLYSGIAHALVQDRVKGFYVHGTGITASEYLWIEE